MNFLKDEATNFVKKAAEKFPEENIVVSFSGGKDYTVTADIVKKALGNFLPVHIFGNTTLEFPTTPEYVEQYKAANPLAIFYFTKNEEQDFYKVCEDIGPPARMMRWCCSMFKTGPISRTLNDLYRNQKISTFYGIRKNESAARSKYNRIESSAASVKIQQQAVASPIFFWKDIDVWLYMPNESNNWRNFLIDFAKKIGKTDAENYVDSGKWKARQGGNALKAAGDIKLRFTNCTTETNAKIYQLSKPFSNELVGLFIPFGVPELELGKKILNETVILDAKTKIPILSVQPLTQGDAGYAVKIKVMNISNPEDFHRQVSYQIKKFNACRKCLKCESICQQGAISIIGDSYIINPQKCIRCRKCVSAKYIVGGCMIERYVQMKHFS